MHGTVYRARTGIRFRDHLVDAVIGFLIGAAGAAVLALATLIVVLG